MQFYFSRNIDFSNGKMNENNLNMSENIKKIIVDWCLGGGCCSRCTLRFAGHMNHETYKNESIVNQKLQFINSQWPSQTSPQLCISCLNLLSEDFIIENIPKIIQRINQSQHEFETFHLNISVPANLTLRNELIMKKIQISLSEQLIDFNFDNILITKDILRYILAEHLQNKLMKKFDPVTPSPFTVTINYTHDDVTNECKKLLTLTPNSFFAKRCKKSVSNYQFGPFNHTSIVRSIEAISDEKQVIIDWELRDTNLECKLDNVVCSKNCIYVAGRYLKFSRQLSQTPWLIDGERKMEGSIQDFITDEIHKKINCKGIKFSSSGREDVDVRMLGRGRPFVLELIDPKINNITKELLLDITNHINNATDKISVRDLQQVSKEDVEINLKNGEETKTKTYQAVCCISREFTNEDAVQLNSIKDLVLYQKTPIRVLHRRTLSTRQRTIHKLWVDQCESCDNQQSELSLIREKCDDSDHKKLFILNLTTEAGCYIKEFVHSDFGRTQPNLASILGICKADILTLDVMEVNMDWPPVLQ